MYSWGRLILHSPAGPTIMFMVVMILIIIIILAKTCLTQSAPASSWVTPSPEEAASSPSEFVFLSSGFVELFSLCQKKSHLCRISPFLPTLPFIFFLTFLFLESFLFLPGFPNVTMTPWRSRTIGSKLQIHKPASITFVFSLQLLPTATIHVFSSSNPKRLLSEYFTLMQYIWSGNRFTRSKQIGVTRARWRGYHTLPDILQHFEDVKTLF